MDCRSLRVVNATYRNLGSDRNSTGKGRARELECIESWGVGLEISDNHTLIEVGEHPDSGADDGVPAERTPADTEPGLESNFLQFAEGPMLVGLNCLIVRNCRIVI